MVGALQRWDMYKSMEFSRTLLAGKRIFLQNVCMFCLCTSLSHMWNKLLSDVDFPINWLKIPLRNFVSFFKSLDWFFLGRSLHVPHWRKANCSKMRSAHPQCKIFSYMCFDELRKNRNHSSLQTYNLKSLWSFSRIHLVLFLSHRGRLCQFFW